MDWQRITALAIVGLTVGVYVWRFLRRYVGPRRFSFEKDTHCGCVSPSGPRPPGLIIRGKRGERPVITLQEQTRRR